MFDKASEFSKAMLAAALAHLDRDRELCKQFLAIAALSYKTPEQQTRLANFCKERGY